MQLNNGGFFGSMTPPGATSFMSPMESSSPSSFTSPPIDPKILAVLASMSGMGQGQGGQQQPQGPSALPPNATLAPGASIPGQPQPGQQPGWQQPAAPQGGANPQLMAALQQLSKLAPDQQKAIMARLGIGAGGGQ